MALNSFLFSFLLHLGTLLPVTAEQNVYSIEGSPVTLSCPDVSSNQNPGTGFWKYNGVEVLKYTNGKPWKVNQDKRFRGTDKGDFSLYMPEAQEGLYTCDVSGQEKSIRLHFLKVTGSPEGSLLQGESLELQLHPPDITATQIEWTGPHNEKSRWNLMDNNQRLQIKNLQVQDDGLWKCSIHSLIISYRVTVIGFLNASDEEIFKAINSTVTLSYTLNPSAQKYVNTTEFLLTQETGEKSVSLRGSGFCSPKTIPKVQFEDGGRYQCRIRFSHGWLNRTIHLVVMKVSAEPLGPLPKEGGVKLCCSISAPPPPGGLLRWDARNESRIVPHCLVTQKASQQTCSLIVGEKVKISVNYTVEEATEQTSFMLSGVVLGAGVPLVLLSLTSVCLFTYIVVKRKKQRAARMAQAKQQLLAKRTCQCQRDQSNDYYHT